MKKQLAFVVLLIAGIYCDAYSQSPRVPSEMEFADMQLDLTDAARREIQTHVDALYRSEKYFNIKLERVDLYFPIIEKIFMEEELPIDFKYLVIQESALISDAVSSSNAVGFWQFKEASAEEVGLRVDGAVDERINIFSSTRGAARYLKRNNNLFDNWLYALLSYNTGAGGAQKEVNDKYFGAKRMEIDKHTHWYIKKFLAHKVAFENATGKNQNLPFTLIAYNAEAGESLREIASKTNVDEELLNEYNKWLKRGSIPDDKEYLVVIPAGADKEERILAFNDNPKEKRAVNISVLGHGSNPVADNRFSKGSEKYPIIEGKISTDDGSVLATINGKPGIIAGPDDNLLTLAEKGDVSISRFLKFNDLNSDDKAVEGQVYYLKNKRGRAAEHYHVVLETENLWSISQKYGIKLKKLLSKNRMEENEQPKPGRVLWMRFVRPSKEPVEYKEVPVSNTIAETEVDEVEIANSQDYTSSLTQEEDQENLALADNSDAESIVSPAEQDAIQATDRASEDNTPEEELSVEEASGSTTEFLSDSDLESFEAQDDVTFVEIEDPENENKDIHLVKEGETLYGIAKQYNVKLGDLLVWNDLSLKDGIAIDQILKISPPEKGEKPLEEAVTVRSDDDFFVHEVTSGETMYKIARDHNVTIKDVMLWNNKEDFKVSIGEKLRIKKLD